VVYPGFYISELGDVRLFIYRFIHSLWLDLQFQSPPLMFCTHMASYNLPADCEKIAKLAGEPIE
jgi:hypothetical protein